MVDKKGVYIDVDKKDWEYFKFVCTLKNRTLKEMVSDILKPEIKKCKEYILSINEFKFDCEKEESKGE